MEEKFLFTAQIQFGSLYKKNTEKAGEQKETFCKAKARKKLCYTWRNRQMCWQGGKDKVSTVLSPFASFFCQNTIFIDSFFFCELHLYPLLVENNG